MIVPIFFEPNMSPCGAIIYRWCLLPRRAIEILMKNFFLIYKTIHSPYNSNKLNYIDRTILPNVSNFLLIVRCKYYLLVPQQYVELLIILNKLCYTSRTKPMNHYTSKWYTNILHKAAHSLYLVRVSVNKIISLFISLFKEILYVNV